MARLEHAQLIQTFHALRTDPTRFALGCYLLELLDRLAPEGGARADAKRMFGFALEALATLDDERPDLRLRTARPMNRQQNEPSGLLKHAH